MILKKSDLVVHQSVLADWEKVKGFWGNGQHTQEDTYSPNLNCTNDIFLKIQSQIKNQTTRKKSAIQITRTAFFTEESFPNFVYAISLLTDIKTSYG